MPKAKVKEININYKVQGKGEPLVMIMGICGGGYAWIFQTRALKKHYKVITFDNRGVGKTDKPDEPYTAKMMADDTIGLMDYLGIARAHILGMSMGGTIAQELAINYPDRVNKLVLACTLANNEIGKDASTDIRKELSRIAVNAFNRNRWLWRVILPLLMRIHFLLVGTRGFKGQYEAMHTHDTLDRLHSIKAPTLVITGTADRVIPPSCSEAIVSQIPDARLVKVENGSHAFFFEMRGKFNQEVLSFLLGS
jgi:pimeloyl-ACP methyl ester carboxylesterase